MSLFWPPMEDFDPSAVFETHKSAVPVNLEDTPSIVERDTKHLFEAIKANTAVFGTFISLILGSMAMSLFLGSSKIETSISGQVVSSNDVTRLDFSYDHHITPSLGNYYKLNLRIVSNETKDRSGNLQLFICNDQICQGVMPIDIPFPEFADESPVSSVLHSQDYIRSLAPPNTMYSLTGNIGSITGYVIDIECTKSRIVVFYILKTLGNSASVLASLYLLIKSLMISKSRNSNDVTIFFMLTSTVAFMRPFAFIRSARFFYEIEKVLSSVFPYSLTSHFLLLSSKKMVKTQMSNSRNNAILSISPLILSSLFYLCSRASGIIGNTAIIAFILTLSLTVYHIGKRFYASSHSISIELLTFALYIAATVFGLFSAQSFRLADIKNLFLTLGALLTVYEAWPQEKKESKEETSRLLGHGESNNEDVFDMLFMLNQE